MNIENARFNMIEQQIRPCDVHDPKILSLFSLLKRENFVSKELSNLAFSDIELPLPGQQNMLSPAVEARLVQELDINPTDKVLEIGPGSGYVTAILAKLASFVYAIELDETNKQLAIHNLQHSGINNVTVTSGNGIEGMPNKAPFDKIFVGGGLVSIPDILKKQLKVGGKLVGFIGLKPVMSAVSITKISEVEFKEKKLFETNVDYLVGEHAEKFKF